MSRKPDYIAYTIRNERWHNIGAAWTHEDGKGVNLVLSSSPLDGKITLRLNTPKPQAEEPVIEDDPNTEPFADDDIPF